MYPVSSGFTVRLPLSHPHPPSRLTSLPYHSCLCHPPLPPRHLSLAYLPIISRLVSYNPYTRPSPQPPSAHQPLADTNQPLADTHHRPAPPTVRTLERNS